MNGYREYDGAAEYVHLLSLPMWQGLRPRLAAALAGVNGGTGPVLELGAGTGLGTEVVLDTVEAAVLAAEPSAVLRAVLLARLAARPDIHRVTVYPAGAADVPLPDRLAGVVGMHMVGHVRPADRRTLWAALAERLAPGAPVVVNLQPPATAVAVPLTPPYGSSVGGLTYQGQGSAEPTGPESVRWRMTYRTLDGDRVLAEVRAEYDWWVLSDSGLAAELTAVGLTVESTADGLVVARQQS